jgi:AcrR family transcriptional regulator
VPLPKVEAAEKHRLREERILRSAQEIALECGYLTLKVADVAKLAEVSVGTLYVHFKSKEGLVAGLAIHALRGRVQTFGVIAESERLNWAEKIVVIVFADFLFSVDHPELFAAEQLGASTAVLKEMPGGVFQWMPRGELKDSRVETVARAAIDAGDFKPWTNRAKQATAIDRGVWTLMAGSSYIWNVTKAYQSDTFSARIPDWLRHNTHALLQGYGWKSKQPEKDIERLAKYTLKKGRFLAPACCLSSEKEST